MSSASKVSVNQVVTDWLGSRIEPKKKVDSVVLAFVSRILEIFGLEYASKVKGLGSKTETVLDQLKWAYCEIQRNFQSGITIRSNTNQWEKTNYIISRYRIDKRSDEQFFEILALNSYKILPFPQKVAVYKHPLPDSVKRIDELREKVLKMGNPELLHRIDEAREKLLLYKHGDSYRLLKQIQDDLFAYPKPDRELLVKIDEAIKAHKEHVNPQLDALKKVEEERISAFHRISGRLRMKSPAPVDEEKGVPPPPPVPIHQRDWTTEEEQSIAEHYYKWPILFFNKRKVYLWELIETWKYLREGAAQADRLLFGPMELRKWLPDGEPKFDPIIEFTTIKADTIEEFIVQCSLLTIENNLEVQFSSSLRATFAQKFRDEESIRSDFCYFTANMRFFYQMDFSTFNRLSTRWLLSAQIYYFIVRTTGLKPEKRSDIFEMILHRNGRWKLESLLAFPHRDWNYKRPLDEEREFRVASRGIGALLGALPNKGNQLKDSYCWPLFYYLWKHPPSPALLGALDLLIKNRHFTFDLEILYHFLTKHGVEWESELVQFFLEYHLTVVDALEQGGIHTQHAECLLIDPPTEHLMKNNNMIGLVKQNTDRFIYWMKSYDFPPDKRFVRMLRQFIHRPNELIFSLLRDCAELGIAKPSEDLLEKALSTDQKGMEAIDEARPIALELARKLQAEFQFADVEVFFLYLEIIRLVKAGKDQNVISRIYAVVIALEKFCPGLKKQIIHFLFLYHPEVSSYFIDAFENMRLQWALSKHLSRFILPQEEFSQIRRPIDAFVVGLAQACNDPEIQGAFIDHLSDAMRAVFFPPRQPIGDAFKISNVAEGEITWKDPLWSTHLGSITFLLKNADVGVHFHWEVCDGYPTFYISFYDMKKKEGFTGVIRLEIPVEDIYSEAKRKCLYMYLYTMSLKVLNEDLPESPLEGIDETPENLMPYYDLLDHDLKIILENPEFEAITNDEISAIWQFFKKVKESYRKLFYCSTANRPAPNPIKVDDHSEVAAMGRIYPSHRRGALLPGSHLLLSRQAKCYVPDAPEDRMKEFGRKLAHPTDPPQRMNLDLQIEGRSPLPISYRSRTTDDVTGENVGRIRARAWDERAAPRGSVLGARYVTLSVVLDGKAIRSTVKYPKECFRESNEVLVKNLAARLSRDEAKLLEGFENEQAEFAYAYDDQSTEILYAKLLWALKREAPRLIVNQLIVVYEEEATKMIYDKLVKALENSNPTFLRVFKEENQKLFEEDAPDVETLYARLLEKLGKDHPQWIETFEAENIRFLDALGKSNLEFLKAFNEEEEKLISAYEAKGVQRFQSYFDVHNLWLKQRVYEALSNAKKNQAKKRLEDSLEILEDIGSYIPAKEHDEEKE